MTELSEYPTFARAFLTAGVILMSMGCSDRRSTSATDSLLSRDLTLAASTPSLTSSAMLGDTAAATTPAPARPTTPAPTTRAAANATRPSPVPVRRPATRPAPPRPDPESSPTPAPTPTPTPVVATVPQPAPSGNGAADASGTNGAGTDRGTRRSIGAGTVLVGRTDAPICSLANRPGDRFVATLTSAVTGPDGARIAAGTPVLVEMAQPQGDAEFAFRVKAVQVDGTLIPIEGTVRAEGATTDRRVSKGGDKEKVVTGAVVGAILGRVLGGGAKGTIIGAAGGAAAGTVAAARNSVTEHCLPAGATLTVTLSAPLVLTQGVP